tara:strand:- start:341 stop:1606 length:1266 start_codon:yes stop_codon:yes gene_type:complete
VIFKKKLIGFIFFSLITLIIYFLITKQIIYPTIIPMIKNGAISLFADWTVILNANLCLEKGLDVYLNNPCDPWGRRHVYGQILLNIPLIETFNKFYFIIFPILINLIFIYVVVNFFEFKSLIQYSVIFLFIFSSSVILAIERANIDIIIFLLTIYISYNKKVFLNYFSIIFAAISKFYPITLVFIFLFDKNFKKVMLNLFFIITIILVIYFFQLEEIIKIFNNSKQFKASGIYNFSFDGFLFYVMNLKVIINKQDYNWIKYLIIFILFVLPLAITLKQNFRFIFNSKNIKDLYLENIYENRLYILSSIIILTCYFSFSNYIYREIFFLGLIPWILKQKKITNDENFFIFYFYLLCVKFFTTSILVYLSMNNILAQYKALITLAKHSLDLYFILIVLIVFLSSLKSLLKNYFKIMFHKTSDT